MDPYQPAPIGAPPLPKPKKPKKPDPAARRMKPIDYVALMLGVEPPPPDADLPAPIGYRFPDPVVDEPMLPPPVAAPPPVVGAQTMVRGLPESYRNHVMRMRMKMGM